MTGEARRLFGALHPPVEITVDHGGPTVPDVAGDDRRAARCRGEAWFQPLPEHRGNDGWLHGGLAATVLDHVCARTAAAALGRRVVTGRLDVRYRKPVMLDGGPYRVEAVADGGRSRTVGVVGAIVDDGGARLVEARSLFVAMESPGSNRQ